jgi:hypothetical protein
MQFFHKGPILSEYCHLDYNINATLMAAVRETTDQLQIPCANIHCCRALKSAACFKQVLFTTRQHPVTQHYSLFM